MTENNKVEVCLNCQKNFLPVEKETGDNPPYNQVFSNKEFGERLGKIYYEFSSDPNLYWEEVVKLYKEFEVFEKKPSNKPTNDLISSQYVRENLVTGQMSLEKCRFTDEEIEKLDLLSQVNVGEKTLLL